MPVKPSEHRIKPQNVRINLRIYANDSDGRVVYHLLHIGFFSGIGARAIIHRLNARGIAYHSNVRGQTGVVEIVTCQMGPGPDNPEIIARSETYDPPHTAHDCRPSFAVNNETVA
jgi:hypothetical protein